MKSVRALALVSAVLGGSVWVNHASAASVLLGNSGWAAEYDDGVGLDITYLGRTADLSSVSIEKFARFYSSAPLTISFVQVSATASSLIKIDDEFVKNDSGSDWTSFTMSINSDGMNGSPSFDPIASASFSVEPFADKSFSDNNTVFTVSGGLIPDAGDNLEDTWLPGDTSGSLVINAKPYSSGNFRQTFQFTESPTGSSPTIPLPAAAYTALSGLLGLGVLQLKSRRLA